jgi:hypothetical protein
VPPGRSGPEQSDEVTVTTRGQGATGSAAKDEAVREALRCAVGMFVDVKTETDGEKIVSDRILSGTGALVLGSKVVAGPTRRADGSYEAECAVRIRKGTLVGQLAAAGFKVTGSMDGDAAGRVAATNLRSAKEAEALLRERLSGLWSKLFVALIIDGKGIPLGDGEVPDVKQVENGNVAVVAVVQVYISPRGVLHQVPARPAGAARRARHLAAGAHGQQGCMGRGVATYRIREHHRSRGRLSRQPGIGLRTRALRVRRSRPDGIG